MIVGYCPKVKLKPVLILYSNKLFLEPNIFTRSHFLASLMKWAEITLDGNTPLIFVGKCLKLMQNIIKAIF